MKTTLFCTNLNAKPSCGFSSMHMRTRLALALISALPQLAWSQATASNENEIVVTSQKRDQLAKNIPVSLTTLGGKQIEDQGLQSIQDVGNSVAGVGVPAATPGQMYLTIRGVSDLSMSNQASSPNGYYIDEVGVAYVPGFMPEVGLFDIERIEVLRGPQGTLFGEGSMGGTLRVITKKPDSTSLFGRYKISGFATEGGGSGFATQASVNLPIVANTLAASLSVNYRDLPGWVDAPDLNRKDTNTSKLRDMRAAIRYTPNAELTVDASIINSNNKLYDFMATSPGKIEPAIAGKPFGAGPIKALSPHDTGLNMNSIVIKYDLGVATLVSASSSAQASNFYLGDSSPGIPMFFPPALIPGADSKIGWDVKSEAFSQEIRLVSNGQKKYNWTVGAYYKNEKRLKDESFTFTIPAIKTVDSPLTHSEQKGISQALFGDVDYQITEQLSTQVGIRYFQDNKEFFSKQITGSNLPLGVPPAGYIQSGKDASNASSPKLGLVYKLNDNLMVFAKYAEGFRAGGANTLPVSVYPYAKSQFGPESVQSNEIGLKSELNDGWYLNTYLYQHNLKDIQLSFRTNDNTYSYVRNAGKATTKGAEIELGGRIGAGLKLGLGYSLTDGKIDADVLGNNGYVVAKAGSRLPMTSLNKVSLLSSYTYPIDNQLTGIFDARYRVASSYNTEISADDKFKNAASHQLFISAGVRGNWGEVRLFVDNALNAKDTLVKFVNFGPPAYILSNYVRPRNYGIEFRGSW
jgi:outer membrane receptor protein involved in Fe transport